MGERADWCKLAESMGPNHTVYRLVTGQYGICKSEREITYVPSGADVIYRTHAPELYEPIEYKYGRWNGDKTLIIELGERSEG